MHSYSLLGALQGFLHKRGVDVEHLTVDPMVNVMIDWFRLMPIKLVERPLAGDVLIYRCGGWSEGCATGYRFSVLRRVTEPDDGGGTTDWYAGITLMFEPSRYADLAPLTSVSSDAESTEAFARSIASSPAYLALSTAPPMSVMLESGGVR